MIYTIKVTDQADNDIRNIYFLIMVIRQFLSCA